MKTRLLGSLVLAAIAFSFAAADDGNFKSIILAGSGSKTIEVPGDQYMIVRNFTQTNDGTARGLVTVNSNSGGTADVLAATLVDPNAAAGAQEPVNIVYIVGGASVTVTCGDGASSCYFTFVKFNKN